MTDNRFVMQTHHLDGYDLLNMAGYQIAQRLMSDAMMDVAAACIDAAPCGEAESCRALAAAGREMCGTAQRFCTTSQLAEYAGICDGFGRRCRDAVDCVQRASKGLSAADNCIAGSWAALRSDASDSALPVP